MAEVKAKKEDGQKPPPIKAAAAKSPAGESPAPKAAAAPPVSNILILKEGFKVDGRWKVVKLLGKGCYGAVYQCEDLTKEFLGIKALKCESTKAKTQSQVLKIEVAVLKAMNRGCPHACKLFARGRNDDYSFIIMSLLGASLQDMQKKQPQGKLSLGTASRITFQCARAVRDMHNCDWIHRDVKPANFAMGGTPNTARTVKIFDFGLARRYRSNNFTLRASREEVKFRGTKRYCSINVHKKEEFGRHDDLISLLYMIVEFVHGKLPWNMTGDGKILCEMKEDLDTDIYNGMPTFLCTVHDYLYGLNSSEQPKYKLLEKGLLHLIYEKGYNKQPLDWEKGLQKCMSSITTDKIIGDTCKEYNVKDTDVGDGTKLEDNVSVPVDATQPQVTEYEEPATNETKK